LIHPGNYKKDSTQKEKGERERERERFKIKMKEQERKKKKIGETQRRTVVGLTQCVSGVTPMHPAQQNTFDSPAQSTKAMLVGGLKY
jgi:hypothetical protein